MAAKRPTYPVKTNNPSAPDNERKWLFTDANEVREFGIDHADKIDAIEAALGLSLGTNSIGVFSSLTLLQAAYPTGANGSYAVIDSGLGGTPYVATFNTTTNLWETATPDESIVWVANISALPNTGLADKLYIARDSGNFYYWTGSEYQTAGPSVELVTKYILNNSQRWLTKKGYGNVGSNFELDDVIEAWYDGTKTRWVKAVVLDPNLSLPADFDDTNKIFLITDTIKL